ncbi:MULTISPECIES: GntR family transcriptional regulator [unclassified Ochrobactrum]|uniref:GntR family transcriptional regulator n=1 Tax=unclassified Ochrobactrum TaxID=239106 RepID=UPI000DEEB008|nr:MULTISPECIES: GntR family transcriptional regulator [unclassified Ochrobactrum]MBQ0711068.1 GntR family transcriptional regulator [Ochrobactrum sp. AP1BH01-1]
MEETNVRDRLTRSPANMPLATMDSWASESLAEQAYRILERSIVTLELEPGTVVNERTLIELTGMGRTPMREAIQRLAWEGLVEVRPRSGIAIAAIDPTDFIKVLDAREGVERVLARDAARFGSPRDFERLEAAAAAMRQAIPDEDVALFLDADKAFDIVLGTAASNPFAARIAAPLQSHSRRFWFRLRPSSGIAGSANAHATLIEAIISRQPERASDTASELMAYLRTLAP